MNEWKAFSLIDLCEIMDSKRKPISHTEREKIKGSFPYYGASGIVDYINDYIFFYDTILISEDGENLNSRKTPIAFRAKGQYWVNNHAHVLLPKREHYFPIITNYIEAMDLTPYITGAVQPKLSQENLLKIKIEMPTSEAEQQAIAGVLSCLDDKIDLLHRQNKTLEGMAETLWRKMFVEEAKPEWKKGKLGDCGQIICGKTPSKKISEYFGGDIPFIKIPDMHGNIFIFDTEDSLTEAGKMSQLNKTIPAKSICVSCIATVGLISMNAIESQTNQQINTVIPNKVFQRYFLFLLLRNMTDDLFARASGGTATDNLNKGDFSRIEISIPDENIIRKYDDLVKEYFEKIYLNSIQIRTLTRMRDTLLPKLMSGELKVKL